MEVIKHEILDDINTEFIDLNQINETAQMIASNLIYLKRTIQELKKVGA